MKSHINLNWLRTFESAARLSGFSAAGRELGLTQVAVSQQIKALESKLGHDLFIRQAKRVQLTDAGRAYLLSVRDGLEKLSHATYGLFGSDINRTIVVRASISMLMWLGPRLAHFSQQNPNIKLKFVTSIWPDPIDTQKVDLDISLMSNDRLTKQSAKLSDEYLVPVCGRKFAKRNLSLNELSRLQPIHILGFDDHWFRYLQHFGVDHATSDSAKIQVDTSVLACNLVASGIGCAVVIERFAKNAIATGSSIRIVGEPAPLHQSIVILKRSSNNEAPFLAEVEAFKEWLQEELLAT